MNVDNFTATSIDGDSIVDNTNETPQTDVQETKQDENVLQQNQPVDATQKIAEVPQGQQAQDGTENTTNPEVTPQQEEVNFETTTVEVGETKPVEQAEVNFDEKSGIDLLSFIEENNDLISAYNKLNQDFTQMEDADLIEAHLTDKHPSLSKEDIKTLMDDFSYEEDSTDKADIVRKKIAASNAVETAKNYLTEKQGLLKQELAQRNLGGPSQVDVEQKRIQQEATQKFTDETNNFFNQDFEGFAFQLNDGKALNLKINNKDAVKSQQASIENFLNPYFDMKTGSITDAKGYHRAIFAATNIDAITRNAYEQGKSDATSQIEKDAKNIDMDSRSTHASNPVPGTSWKIT